MMDEYIREQIAGHRATARSLGEAALDAIRRGDIGLARTASRQAAQYARIVLQLETGEKQVAPADALPAVSEERNDGEASPSGAAR
jgi:hypothetical protein